MKGRYADKTIDLPIVNRGGCSAYERAYCIETRAENEPETLMTDVPGILVCPACGFKLNWGNHE